MKNAIERRIDSLAEVWNAFAADPEPRLLRWRGSDDDLRMVELFIDLQNEEVGTTPDLFVKLMTPFLHPDRYGFDLAEALNTEYEASRTDLADAGLSADWKLPVRATGESDRGFLLRASQSLCEHYRKHVQCLVLVLIPSDISDVQAFQMWLLDVVREPVPEDLRLLLVDRAVAPLLDGIDEAERRCIRTVDPDLDMPSAIEELARAEGREGPGKAFRLHFVNLAQAAGRGNVAAAQQSAVAALKIAKEHGWLDQAAVIHMTLGGALLAAKRPDEAVARYERAVRAADAASEAAHPAGPQLAVITRMAEGSALFAAGRHGEAAQLYEATAPLAKARPDPMMTLECWRMASYCHELASQLREAWRCGQTALDEAELLSEEQRAASTLPYVGQALLRLLREHHPDEGQIANVRSRMAALAGDDWERGIEQGSAAA